MEIRRKEVTVGQICEGYVNEGESEEGVTGYDDNLNIRPKYQRNYIYEGKDRDEVVRSVLRGYPLSVFYWVDLGETYEESDEPRYEILDGQQRTISICDYVSGAFSVDGHYFHSLPKDKQNAILGYEPLVFVCDGAASEKLEWFKIINIKGKELTDQETRNAVYAGPWVSDARRYFSKTRGPAQLLAGDYLNGKSNRQEYMQTAIEWHMDALGYTSIEEYMSERQNRPTAQELWSYFRNVIEWAQAIFPEYHKTMKGRPWGGYYNAHHGRTDLDPERLKRRVRELLGDREVKKKGGIYEYLLTGDERCLQLREFDDDVKEEAYARQGGVCPLCGERFEIGEMQGDHIVPWSKGGKTVPENCQMLCTQCNIKKSNK